VRFPPTMSATESLPPNIALATQRLHPRGVVVVADPDEPPLPLGDGAFELLTSRHPATIWWDEIARVLCPGGQSAGLRVRRAQTERLTVQCFDIGAVVYFLRRSTRFRLSYRLRLRTGTA
jgi:hypothetical protein